MSSTDNRTLAAGLGTAAKQAGKRRRKLKAADVFAGLEEIDRAATVAGVLGGIVVAPKTGGAAARVR